MFPSGVGVVVDTVVVVVVGVVVVVVVVVGVKDWTKSSKDWTKSSKDWFGFAMAIAITNARLDNSWRYVFTVLATLFF